VARTEALVGLGLDWAMAVVIVVAVRQVAEATVVAVVVAR